MKANRFTVLINWEQAIGRGNQDGVSRHATQFVAESASVRWGCCVVMANVLDYLKGQDCVEGTIRER
jgi:hypothetical protein